MEKIRTLLVCEDIILRKPEPEDLDFLFQIENNSEFWFFSETKAPYSKWELKEHIKNSVYDIYTNKELRLIIEDKHTNKQIGIVDLFEFDPFNSRVGLGIIVQKEFQNNRVANKAISLVLEYCFKVLGLNQIWCNIDENNMASIKLFESLGFVKTGILYKWKKVKDVYSDVLFYQLINKG